MEASAQLYQFDRSGAQRSTKIIIHTDAVHCVRLVLGVCSLDDRINGFDTTVVREGDCRYLTAKDTSGTPYSHPLNRRPTNYSRRAIRGRGTVCWNTKSADGTASISPYVVSPVCWPDGTILPDVMISDLREMNQTDPIFDPFRQDSDRVLYRSTLKVRMAYQQLRKQNTASVHKFRLSMEAPKLEIRDVDRPRHALAFGRGEDLMPVDFKIIGPFGTLAFQSVMVLMSCNYTHNMPPHDYPDDLEPFFYILARICLGYERPGIPTTTLPVEIRQWEDSPVIPCRSETHFLLLPPGRRVSEYFRGVLQVLLDNMRQFLKPRMLQKSQKRENSPSDAPIWRSSNQSQIDYNTFLGFIDDAIVALAEEGAKRDSEAETKAPPVLPAPMPIAAPLRPPRSPHVRKYSKSSQKRPASQAEE
ncbi:hypothetical protein BDZ97DRAFT_2056403 [Flammula alnicola]|nr:hypothetical protein BDZ97DRAFT_2056403 [Flammula alnicola]